MKFGALLAVYLTKFAKENDNFKEKLSFPRKVGDLNDRNSVKDNKLRNACCHELLKFREVILDRK